MALLAWAQEVWSSNLHAPTNFLWLNDLQRANFGAAALWCNLGTIRKICGEKSLPNIAQAIGNIERESGPPACQVGGPEFGRRCRVSRRFPFVNSHATD